MAKGLFIAGTDTGVGKTLVAAGLIAVARGKGRPAVGYKPVETGCSLLSGALFPDDGAMLVKASENNLTLEECAPLRFALPAAPHRAAKIIGERLSPDSMIKGAEALAARFDPIIVEAAGGLMVPLNEESMIIDLAVGFGYPVILVARMRLGTINHILLSVESLLRRDLEIRAIILSQSGKDSGPEEEYTMEDLRSFTREIPLLRLPYMSEQTRSDPIAIARVMEEQWDRSLVSVIFD